LSADWIGFKARQLFEAYRRLLGTYANQFVDEVVKGERGTVAIDKQVAAVPQTVSL
jgi:DNA-binding transcriptional regulator PaaX